MATHHRKHYLIPSLTVLYLVLLSYGSIHPINSWQWPEFTNWIDSFEKETRYTPYSDLVINFLIYIPLGLFGSMLLKDKQQGFALLLLISSISSFFSLVMECLQLFIPSRAQSFVDFTMNTLGAITGGFIYLITSRQTMFGTSLVNLRKQLFARGRFSELGLIVIAIWALSELSPLAPTLTLNTIASDINHFQFAIRNSEIDLPKLLFYSLQFFALGVIINYISKENKSPPLLLFAFIGVILILKIPVEKWANHDTWRSLAFWTPIAAALILMISGIVLGTSIWEGMQ